MTSDNREFETVIGLEIHVELSTETKIFCPCSAHSFGSEANTNICPVCCGMPGAIPRLNRRVVEYGIKAATLLSCQINRDSAFDKKNYFYPDLPSGYQRTQWYSPLAVNGYLEIDTESGKKKIGIKQIHLEEDAGKLIHRDNCTLVDLNRSGVPLAEIVTKPDLSSGKEVEAFLDTLRRLLRYARISGAVMAKGELRCDVNLSVRPKGSDVHGVRVELKNMNSVEAIKKAVEYERERHINAILNGETIPPETRGWDEEKQVSYTMRSKENAENYRYFPDCKIPPVHIDEEWLTAVQAELPEPPEVKKQKYASDYGLSVSDAARIAESIAFCECFEAAAEISGSPKDAVNWLTSEIAGELNARRLSREDLPKMGKSLGETILLLKSGRINRTGAREIVSKLFDIPDLNPKSYAETNGLILTVDEEKLNSVIADVIDSDPRSVSDYLDGKEKALMALFGKCMKALSGGCDPKILREALTRAVEKLRPEAD